MCNFNSVKSDIVTDASLQQEWNFRTSGISILVERNFYFALRGRRINASRWCAFDAVFARHRFRRPLSTRFKSFFIFYRQLCRWWGVDFWHSDLGEKSCQAAAFEESIVTFRLFLLCISFIFSSLFLYILYAL